jgi:hypothetical protein
LCRGHPNPTHNWQPDLDDWSGRPHSVERHERVEKEVLAGEVNAKRHGLPRW